MLCEANGAVKLFPLETAALLKPYASDHRSIFFCGQPSISTMYLEADGDARWWRECFERQKKPPQGLFQLSRSMKELTADELKETLANEVPGFEPPPTSKAAKTKVWRDEYELDTHNYLLIDCELPPGLKQVLGSRVEKEQARALARWLHESRDTLSELTSDDRQEDRERFFVYSVSFKDYLHVDGDSRCPASWVSDLTRRAWVLDHRGQGPHRPEEVLPAPDENRPGARVADLTPEVIEALTACGVQFGHNVGQVVAAERSEKKGRENGDKPNDPDEPYRIAAMAYEVAAGRFPVAKSEGQSDHDLDSYSHEEGHPERRLVRRIEVKGKERAWEGDVEVTMTSVQFLAAANHPEDEAYDYWLYVAERVGGSRTNGEYKIVAIQNPARLTEKVEVKASTWRFLGENE